MPYTHVKIKTERIFKAPGSTVEPKDGFPAEWFYVGPGAWTLSVAEATELEDLDAVLIISDLEKAYPGVEFKIVVVS